MGGHLALHLKDVAQSAVFQAVAEIRVRAVAGVRDQGCGPKPGAGEFVEHVQCEPPFRLVMLVLGDPAGLPAAGRLRAVPGCGQEQTPGQRARSGIGSGVDADADLTVAHLAQVPEYWRATPADALPSLRKPVSSTTHTCGRTARTARHASRARTSSMGQVEEVMNCCNC